MNLRQLGILACTGAAVLISCGDEQTFGVPNEGAILVAALTTGDDQDPNGYTFSINNGSPTQILLLDTVYVADLEPGDYQVALAGIADNCTPAPGTNPQTATVMAGDTVSTVFNVTCEVIDPGGGGDALRLGP
jgi:hypothetical protein